MVKDFNLQFYFATAVTTLYLPKINIWLCWIENSLIKLSNDLSLSMADKLYMENIQNGLGVGVE